MLFFILPPLQELSSPSDSLPPSFFSEEEKEEEKLCYKTGKSTILKTFFSFPAFVEKLVCIYYIIGLYIVFVTLLVLFPLL